ncbi:MAG: leucine-rich repeat domain-containing protein [Verrucomicrobiota bacterium]|jgi:hypothetical protein
MKLTRTLILIGLIEAMLLVFPAVVRAQFNYITYNGAAFITGYTGTNATVVIPATIDGYPVTSIYATAFNGNQTITNVIISGGITSIGDLAFANCDNLCQVTIPNSVTNVGDHAFWSCGFASFIIPANTVMGNGALSSCINLKNVTLPSHRKMKKWLEIS